MGTKMTRFYEVKASLPKDQKGLVLEETIYLIEATGLSAARMHVANKFISPATIANAKRVAELMGKGVAPELAEEA
jgi:hypothetical protein